MLRDMGDEWPIVVERPLGERLGEALFYGIATPIIALGVGVMVGPFAAGLLYELLGEPGAPHDPPIAIFVELILVGLTTALGVMALIGHRGLSRYRQGAGRALRLWPDRLERDLGRSVESWPFAEVTKLQLIQRGHDGSGASVKLTLEGGRKLELMAKHWKLDEVVAHLRAALVPAIGERIRRELEEGEVVECREPRGYAAMTIGFAIMVGIWGVTLLVVLVVSLAGGHGWDANATRAGYCGLLFSIGGAGLLKFGFSFLGGGLALTWTGVRRVKDGPAEEIPWREASVVDTGGRIEVTHGSRRLHLTSFGENHAVLVDLLPRLAGEGKLEAP
jgi:hypothetical protein